MNNPDTIPKFLLPVMRHYYDMHDRKIIQFDSQYAHYDPELFYLLNEGEFYFENREFNNAYRINSAGLRDNESSLDNPEIIILGDSYAMGWGVEQQETFAHLMEQMSGKKVLNAAVSSYGTVRELKVLDRLDLDSVKYVFIQYCSNDYPENKNYYDHGNEIQISNKTKFDSILFEHIENRKYYPLKHVISISKIIGRRLRSELFSSEEKEIDAHAVFEREMLINALKSNAQTNVTFQLVLFNLSGRNSQTSVIDQTLAQMIQRDSVLQNMDFHVTALDDQLNEKDYYILDEHINKHGHRKIAAELIKYINQ